jgi:nitroreductase
MGTPTVDRMGAEAVAAAVRAPSMLNSQPWRFRVTAEGVEVHLDRSRVLHADPGAWAARLACGAAVFNIRMAFAAHGYAAEVVIRPDPGRPDLLALVRRGERQLPEPQELALFAAIPKRFSNRRPFSPRPVPATDRSAMVAAARLEGAWLELLIGPFALTALAEITRAADRVLDRDPEYRRELHAWTRRTGGQEGVPVSAGGLQPEPQDLLAMRDFGGRVREEDQEYEPEPLLAVLGTAGDSPADQLVAGQALQRVLLTITDAGLAASMLSQPIEVPAAREQLRLALGRFGTPQMVLRIGYGEAGEPTPRRPLAEVLLP